ncbi:MAG: hypothetical protein KGH96_20300 [Sphingomonadales bacterium]|nr:hypothetical protein [Sphingomonadales bacterium]
MAVLVCFAQAHAVIAAIPHLPRFDEIESDFDGDDRLPNANKVIRAAVPLGTTVLDAQATLERAGARCRSEPQKSRVICDYSDRITVDDYYPGDVTWTTTLRIEAGLVTGLAIDRALIKH